jgi:hypothetical protein
LEANDHSAKKFSGVDGIGKCSSEMLLETFGKDSKDQH